MLRVLAGARRLADAGDPIGREARLTLPQATGLSPEGVELGLARHLETEVSAEDLALLVTRAKVASRVHVLLSANVFVGAIRAVALAVAAAPTVLVRASSRESIMAPLLDGPRERTARASSSSPKRSSREPGDEIHVYGRSETIAADPRNPAGVRVRGHGPGFGVALIDPTVIELDEAAKRLSWDVVAFDQRGCLSPRLAMVVGSEADAELFAKLLADELGKRETEVPRGALADDEKQGKPSTVKRACGRSLSHGAHVHGGVGLGAARSPIAPARSTRPRGASCGGGRYSAAAPSVRGSHDLRRPCAG